MRVPRFDWDASTLTLSIPAKPWTPGTQGIGAGREESAAGVPSAWITRRDYTMGVELVFTEAEWPSVRAMIEHGQEGGVITWYPDAAVPATSYACILVAPAIDEDVRPARGEYFGTLVLSITLRRTTGAAMDPVFYA